ncbi:hypothetical protein CSPX01_06328 [Colletotrichum filicis]|nr:hypothetical protein CSPX01_06328 [Colletotrichum filicis]
MASVDEYSLTDEPDYDGGYSPQVLEEAGAMHFDGDEEDDVDIDGIVQGTRRRRYALSQAPTEPEEPRSTRPARRKAPKRGRSPSVEVVLPDRTKRKKTSHLTPKSRGVAERSREEDSPHSSSPEPTEGHVLWGLVRENLSKKMSTARVREYMDETLPILTKRQLDRLFPKKLPKSKYDEDWTRKDEKKLQREWKKNASGNCS